jgi:hypothetical protein
MLTIARGLTGLSVASHELPVTFIAPPWGNALQRTSGLDLRRTSPPVIDVVDLLLHRFRHRQLLCLIQVYEIVRSDSMGDLRRASTGQPSQSMV